MAPPVNPHVGALLTFANMPWGWTTASFPHGDFVYQPPAIGSCVAEVTPPQEYPPRPVPQEPVMQLSLWGPTGEGQVLPVMTEGDYPYYLLSMDPYWPAAMAAGKTFRWQILGQGAVPDFEVSFVAPEPIVTVTPMPKGDGLIDFARSSPPVVTWNAATFGGQQVAITISGGDLAQIGSARTLECYPADTGTFQLPATELVKFYPDQVLIRVIRYTASSITAPGLSGGGIVKAFSGYLPLDGQGAAVPMLFTVN